MERNSIRFNVSQAAEYLGISHHTVRLWVKEKKLPCIRLGRRVLFDRQALDAYLQEKTQPHLPEPGESR